MQAIADAAVTLRAFYQEHLGRVDAWRDVVGGERAVALVNSHVDESRQREKAACLWGVRCIDGYVIHSDSQGYRDGTAAELQARNGASGYRVPVALLHRDVPGGEWREAPLTTA
jgi:hypothetical protein